MSNSVILPTTFAFVPTTTTQIAMSVTEIEQRYTELRNDLKHWEKKFAAQNNGRKAGRDDIKANEDICTHATQRLAGDIWLTTFSKQVQRVQQATRQIDSPGRTTNTLETYCKPKGYPRHCTNAQRTT
jgi:hypothetical protein